MIEVHPFGNFIPSNTQYLLLGSFTTKPSDDYLWFYANGRNQFWPIMEEVYGLRLDTKDKQQSLFQNLNMALADIILSCERSNNSNLDNNLANIVYNTKAVNNIFRKNNTKKVFFTSRFVESTFSRLFKDFSETYFETKLIYLPSPSPRYAAISKEEKIRRYKELLPRLSKS